MFTNVLGNQERFLFAKMKKENPQLAKNLPGELKIKVHLPINSSPRGSTNPDKVMAASYCAGEQGSSSQG
jgi:hypothetical protein